MSLEDDFRFTTNLLVKTVGLGVKACGKVVTTSAGLVSYGVTKHKINSDNKKNRGLIFESPQDISSICANAVNKNMIISGGDNSLRALILAHTLSSTTVYNGSGVIILHMSDNQLVNTLNSLRLPNTVRIDAQNKNYDPFYHRTDDEIIQIISDSLPNNMTLNNNAMNLIRGIRTCGQKVGHQKLTYPGFFTR